MLFKTFFFFFFVSFKRKTRIVFRPSLRPPVELGALRWFTLPGLLTLPRCRTQVKRRRVHAQFCKLFIFYFSSNNISLNNRPSVWKPAFIHSGKSWMKERQTNVTILHPSHIPNTSSLPWLLAVDSWIGSTKKNKKLSRTHIYSQICSRF